MSDSSSSDGEDVNTTGLIATLAKRATAGNLYATLRANLDDEDLQRDLLAEDEEDQGDYEGSDREDDDATMESSSDEEDAGFPKEGEAEDLEGEKELKKQERAANRKKRKMDEARMRLPAWQKKRVKLADDVKTQDGTTKRPKKKSERSNWMPAPDDMPVRQSARASAIANREVVHTNLKESAIRSEKQKQVMAKHAEKVHWNKRAELTQEERLAKAVKIEKETAREFGRWEREEAERQRIREEQLAAKRNRGIDGPVVRHWSGSVLWVGDKLENKRLHGSTNVEEIKEEPKDTDTVASDTTGEHAASKSASTTNTPLSTSGSGPSSHLQQFPSGPPQQPPLRPPNETNTQLQSSQNQRPVSWLDGIQEYAARPTPSSSAGMPLQPSSYTPSAPAINGVSQQSPLAPQPSPYTPLTTHPAPPPHPLYNSWPPGYQEFSLQRPQVQMPLHPTPPAPLIKEQAQRSLIMLEHFERLDATSTIKRGTTKAIKEANVTDPTPTASALLPLSYPSFTPDESRYLTSRMKKVQGVLTLPTLPTKTKCALTSWPARFRDPKTGLPYADLQSYKMIQRILAGGCAWSGLLGAWSGPQYGSMGRAANGVPDGFGNPAPLPDAVKTEPL